MLTKTILLSILVACLALAHRRSHSRHLSTHKAKSLKSSSETDPTADILVHIVFEYDFQKVWIDTIEELNLTKVEVVNPSAETIERSISFHAPRNFSRMWVVEGDYELPIFFF